jgi:putative N-acetylmannosamine-6-phosphate epimerase
MVFYTGVLRPKRKEMIQTTKKTKKRILVSCVAVPEIPLNPKKAAIMAMTRKARVQ